MAAAIKDGDSLGAIRRCREGILIMERLPVRSAAPCACHHQPEACQVGALCLEDAHNLTPVDDSDPVAKRQNLFELGRYQQDGRASVALGQQLPPDVLGGAHVEPAGGLFDHQDPGLAHHLAPQHEFLQVTSRQLPGHKR